MRRFIITILVLPFLLGWHWFEPAARKNQEGISAYQQEKYEEALERFLSAKGIKPDMAELQNNTAVSLYQLKKYKEALEEFSQINPEKTNIDKDTFFYNLGNAFFRLNQFDKALACYKKSLLDNPEDIQAKKNFELTLKKIQQQQQQKQDKQNDKDQKDKDKEQQQQKEQRQKKHQQALQYLNQQEKEQMKDKKRKVGIARKEKDW